MIGPDSGLGEDTTVCPCSSANTRSRELAPGTPVKFSGNFSPGWTGFTPADVSMHSPRALKISSSQRVCNDAGGELGADGVEGSGLYCRPNSVGLSTQ